MDNDQNINIIIPYNISNINIMSLLFTRGQDMKAFAIHMDHNMGSYAIFFTYFNTELKILFYKIHEVYIVMCLSCGFIFLLFTIK